MYSFEIDCPNEGLGRVMQALNSEGIRSESRNGPVIRFPKPVCLAYPNPNRRVINHPVRDANHFFHLIETMWMFGGMNTVAPLDLFNEQFKQYSDDGITFAAPYGFRWRYHFSFDQIREVVQKLKANPEDRRIVLQIWDPEELRKKEGKDFACNQQILFDTRASNSHLGGYALDMTVTNRSNDLIYGAMGSNLFHMSMLHEYIALHAGLGLGTYYQFSKNMHLYLENPKSQQCWEHMSEFTSADNVHGFKSPAPDGSLREFGLTLRPEPIKRYVETHQIPAKEYALIGEEDPYAEHSRGYLGRVVSPVVEAYKIYKTKNRTGIDTRLEARVEFAIDILQNCESDPLRIACTDWLTDKVKNKSRKKGAA